MIISKCDQLYKVRSFDSLLVRGIQGYAAFFPGPDVPVKLPQSQIMQCSDKKQKTQELYFRLYRPQLAC